MSSVILSPVSSLIYRNDNLEPQRVTAKIPNRAIIYLDSQDCAMETDKINIQMSTASIVGESPSVLASGIDVISVESIGIQYNIPNVNPRNNTIRLHSSVSAAYHTVDLIEGFYTTADLLMAHIVVRLNTISGASGLTFSAVVRTGRPDVYDLSAAGGLFYFDQNCSAVKKGYQLYNFPTDQTPSTSKVVGSMGMYYTRYIDVCSTTLTRFVKIKSNTTGLSNNLLIRVFINDPTKSHTISFNGTENIIYNFIPSEPITSIIFQLRDQFGDTLYTPTGAEGTAGGFFWDCNLLIEG